MHYWVSSLVGVSLCIVSLVSGTCFQETYNNSNSNDVAFSTDKLEFTLDMFHKLYSSNKTDEETTNLFFSPHSIHQALLLALMGAKGQTETELRAALKVGTVSKMKLIEQYKMDNFLRETGCNASNKGVEFHVANKLYFDKEEPISPCMSTAFATELEQLDIAHDAEGARKTMNDWVEEQTKGKISQLIPSLSPQTRFAIVNSAYFKGVWEQQFKKSRTKLGLFYPSDHEVIYTHFMYQKGNFRHGVSEMLKSYILELPYEGEHTSMIILLPPFTPNALEETIAKLNASSLEEAMNDMVHDSIEVMLPRFRLSYTVSLTSALSELGIHDLFNQSSSDLSDFSSKPGLAVEEAIHKSYIEVNEEGATAAAATALIGTRSGRPLEQTRFVCNHPFVFMIYDHCTKTVLFIGAMKKPIKA